MWQYHESTGDLEVLADHGAEMMLDIARFRCRAATYDRGRDRYVIRGVMGPDEFHTGSTLSAQVHAWVLGRPTVIRRSSISPDC